MVVRGALGRGGRVASLKQLAFVTTPSPSMHYCLSREGRAAGADADRAILQQFTEENLEPRGMELRSRNTKRRDDDAGVRRDRSPKKRKATTGENRTAEYANLNAQPTQTISPTGVLVSTGRSRLRPPHSSAEVAIGNGEANLFNSMCGAKKTPRTANQLTPDNGTGAQGLRTRNMSSDGRRIDRKTEGQEPNSVLSANELGNQELEGTYHGVSSKLSGKRTRVRKQPHQPQSRCSDATDLGGGRQDADEIPNNQIPGDNTGRNFKSRDSARPRARLQNAESAGGFPASRRGREVGPQTEDARGLSQPDNPGETLAVPNSSEEEDEIADLEKAGDLDDFRNAKAAFETDLSNFRKRHPHGEDNLMRSSALETKSIIAISLPAHHFSSIWQLMKRRGWSGIKSEWNAHLISRRKPESPLAKQFVKYIPKLERFCLVVLESRPSLTGQRDFFNENCDYLRHYSEKIQRCVYSVLEEDLWRDPRMRKKATNGERKARVEELTQLIIPLLIRLFSRAWFLGGDEHAPRFTDFLVPLLVKILNWVQLLYSLTMQELDQKPFSQPPKAKTAKEQWQMDKKFRIQLRTHLDKLEETIKDAPMQLKQEEIWQKKAEERERQLQRIQEEIRQEQEADLARRKAEHQQQNDMVMRAILNGRSSPMPYDPPSIQATMPVEHYNETEWRREEEVALCKILQEAYQYDPPRLRDLADTSRSLGHNEQEVINKSRDLLNLMLLKADSEISGPERQRKISKLIRQWRAG
ncbi:hypothetical protein BX600DRAFT_497393 [Xylariales sp. PMI_506]|nr:hypothetical protein BX600DRAFT_497393 [Xylariales sp. PMI_506]